MKKQNVPDTSGKPTPEFVRAVKDNIDAVTGKRNNKINLPEIQTKTFSSPPTQAECQALNAYMNEWYKSIVLLVARFDS